MTDICVVKVYFRDKWFGVLKTLYRSEIESTGSAMKLFALALNCHLGELLDALGEVLKGKETRPSDEAVGPGVCAGTDGLLGCLDPAVYLNVHVQVAVDDPLPNLSDLVQHGGNVFLSAKAGIDRHDQDVVDQV